MGVDLWMELLLRELEFSYARSSGPGGQNVNKTSTKAVLRWNLAETGVLPSEVRMRFLQAYGTRITVEGDLVLASDRTRDQARNREDCLEKLRAMLAHAAVPPKKRRKTKPTRSSQKKRVESKRRRSEVKRGRGGAWD